MDGKMKVYPNPVRERLQFNLTAPTSGIANVSVVDYSGRVIMNRSLSVQKGANNIILPLPAGNAGAYRVIVKGVVESNASFVRIQ
jgi:hypothetical protein